MLHESIHRWISKDGSVNVIYPYCCRSLNCGGYGDSCKRCKHYPILESFNKWVEENKAVVLDPVWGPQVYTAPPMQQGAYDVNT